MFDFDRPRAETPEERIRRIREAVERLGNSGSISRVDFRMNSRLSTRADSRFTGNMNSAMFIL